MTVCSGYSERERCAMPVGADEMRVTNRYAAQLRREMEGHCGCAAVFQRTLKAYTASLQYRQDMAEIYQGWRPLHRR
jgi:hypothetical protein